MTPAFRREAAPLHAQSGLAAAGRNQQACERSVGRGHEIRCCTGRNHQRQHNPAITGRRCSAAARSGEVAEVQGRAAAGESRPGFAIAAEGESSGLSQPLVDNGAWRGSSAASIAGTSSAQRSDRPPARAARQRHKNPARRDRSERRAGIGVTPAPVAPHSRRADGTLVRAARTRTAFKARCAVVR